MTTIRDIPQETLSIIFEQLDINQLQECLKVCKAWYLPAQIAFLKEILLTTEANIRQFIETVDSSPNSLYQKAVKSIELDVYHFNSDANGIIAKLFTRFPNLNYEDLDQIELLESFSDEVCMDIIRSCPKLHEFTVHDAAFREETVEPDSYNGYLHKARLLITSMTVYLISESQRDISEYLSSFPRLKTLKSDQETNIKFETLLPVFKQIPNLTYLTFTTDNDQEGFAEDYLATLSRSEQELVVKRLNQVKRVQLYTFHGFCVNQMKFFTKYLTGLNEFCIYSYENEVWTDRIIDILTLTRSVNHKFFILFYSTDLEALADHLHLVLETVFPQTTSKDEGTGTLVLSVEKKLAKPGSALMAVSTGLLTITVANSLSFHSLGSGLAKYDIPACNIEVFDAQIPEEKMTIYDATVLPYEKVIRALPSLKYVTLDITSTYSDDYMEFDDKIESNNLDVEDLTLKIAHTDRYQSVLDRCSVLFPYVAYLNICYCSGAWNQHLGEYQTILPQYSLEKLSLDMTQLKIESYLRHRDPEFFIVDLEITSRSERHMYEISFKDFAAVSVDNQSLQDLIVGKDYLRARVVIDSLKTLELCIRDTENTQNTRRDDPKRVCEIKIPFLYYD